MLYGTREQFEYFECASCGTLQIVEVPEDLARHYPPDYLGYGGEPSQPRLKRGARAFLRRQYTRYLLYRRNILGWVAERLGERYTPYRWVDFDLDWLRRSGATPGTSILEVGCGPGWLLRILQELGFTRLTGLDPFQEATLPGLDIHRCNLDRLEGSYELIMLHHSFEHMPDPSGALAELKRLCAPEGVILIRIPVAKSHAWSVYGPDWVQLDPPRHLVIPSRQGVEILARDAGLELFDVVFDSTELQFWGSEQYRRDVAMRSERSYMRNPEASLFSREEIEGHKASAAVLNMRGDGDQACFYLRKPSNQDHRAV